MSSAWLPRTILIASFFTAISCPLAAQTKADKQISQLLKKHAIAGTIQSAIGVTRAGTSIPCLITKDDLDLQTKKFRILLVGGLDGEAKSVMAALNAVQWFAAREARSRWQDRFAVSCVPCANPDGWAAGRGVMNLSGGQPAAKFPPQGKAYNDPMNPEAHYLWRWIGMHAPDLVVDIRAGDEPGWRPAGDERSLQLLAGIRPMRTTIKDHMDLILALAKGRPCDTGSIPAVRLEINQGPVAQLFSNLLNVLDAAKTLPISGARQELQSRLRRSPIQIANELSRFYGRDLKQVVYIPTVALIGRLRLGELTNDSRHLREVQQMVQPYLQGQRPTMGKRPSGSALSGHLIFTQLAMATGNKAYLKLARNAADLGFDGRRLRPSMPAHSEMSDSVFMGCPILAETGQLTKESRYFDMCLQHLQFMQRHCLRKDGLYRHSPLDESAWGRGNGFPALGLALTLSALPDDYAGRAKVLASVRRHLTALREHQDPTGAWHQVIDRPESYRELTSTCMITFAMARGVRRGWLPAAEFKPSIQRAWRAIQTRIGREGKLVDVCTGTGKQPDLRAYYDRAAILGRDARGGAMALLVSTEIAALAAANKGL